MKIALIKEGKIPPDERVCLTPSQCRVVLDRYPDVEIKVQPSEIRAFSEKEYEEKGAIIDEDISDCDVLLGIKEVPVEDLIQNKTYMFFSHTVKMQPNNREMLQEILKKNIELIDHELLTNEKGKRLLGFGRFDLG
ncbi:MAG: hypothetical protein ABEH43_09410 [Flavobacteriales bacterium]